MSTKELSARLASFGASATGVVHNKVNELVRSGQEILSLNVGEPDFDTPETARTAGIAAIVGGFTRYTSTNGTAELREVIAEKLARENGLSYAADEICVSTGAKQAIFEAVMAICNEGDEVLIPVPSWVSYSAMTSIAGAKPVLIPSRPDYSLDLEKIEAAVTPRTKAVIICSPNNPSGAVYSGESLRALAALAVKYDFFIISDEIYEKLIYDGEKHVSIASVSEEVRERTITVNGFSKAYAMTGWRIGYAAARKDIIKAMIKLQGQITSCPNSVAQKAAIGALMGPQDEAEAMVKVFRERRDFVCGRVSRIPQVSFTAPRGAFYMLVDISRYLGKAHDGRVIENDVQLCEYLIDEAHVALVPGSAFGADGAVRIAYANSMDILSRALDEMEKALLLLK